MDNAPSLDERIQMHRRMIVTRRIKERLGELHREGRTRGPLHRCDGQEAVGVGGCAALTREDYVATTHRGHHVYVGKGLDPRRIVAEIFGRATGYCGGRGGHMLLGDASTGMLGGNAIVGAGIPAATGMALSIQLLKQDRVAMCVFGDGAAQTGICHESMNIASLWKLPVIFLLEHNQYGLTVHHGAQSSVPDLYVRAAGYAMPGEMVREFLQQWAGWRSWFRRGLPARGRIAQHPQGQGIGPQGAARTLKGQVTIAPSLVGIPGRESCDTGQGELRDLLEFLCMAVGFEASNPKQIKPDGA